MVLACEILHFFFEYLIIFLETYATTVACCLLIILIIIISKCIKRISVDELEIEIDEEKNAIEGENIEICGRIKFNPMVKSVKWQKLRRDAEFIDINIQSMKYKGTSNDIENPKLCISSVDVSDESEYRLEALVLKQNIYFDETGQRIKPKISKQCVHSNISYLKILNFKETEIEISCNGKTEDLSCIYGESVAFKARIIRNPESILCMTWQKVTNFGTETLNTREEKYTGSTTNSITPELHIRDISLKDEALFYVLATSCHKETESNKIYLKVQGEEPNVSLKQDPKNSVDFGETVKYISSIRCNPIPRRIIWKRGNNPIEIGSAKYRGSSEVFDCPVLIINDVDKDDEDVYSLEVHNAVGRGVATSERLVVNDALPEVQLSVSKDSPPIQYGNNIILLADIKSSPKATIKQWKKYHERDKEGETINIKSEKYHNSDERTLVINNLDYNDQGKYEINVTNANGTTTKEITIEVLGAPMVFISGPTVVSPFSTIEFQICYIGIGSKENLIWQISTKQNSIYIDVSIKKDIGENSNTMDKPDQSKCQEATQNSHEDLQYSQYFSTSSQNDKFLIENAKDAAIYQLSSGTMKSNKIDVFVDVEDKFATEGQTNCCRFLCILSICTDVMRNVFDKLEPLRFEEKMQLFQETCPSGTPVKGKHLPTSSKDLDISLLYKIIRNGTKISPPLRGWGKVPAVNATAVADDIERIRIIRNDFFHDSTNDIDTTTFNNWTLDLIKIICRLSPGDKKVMEKLCSELNKVCYKGENLREMQEELKRLREEFSKVEGTSQKDDFQRHSTMTKLYIKERSRLQYRIVQDYAREMARSLETIADRIDKTPFIHDVYEELESEIAKKGTLHNLALDFLDSICSSLGWPSSRTKPLIILVHYLIALKKSCDYPDISVSCVGGFFAMNLELSKVEMLENYRGFGGEERLKEILLNASTLSWYQLTPEDIIIEEVKVFKNLDEPQIQLYGPSLVKKGQCVQLRAMIVSCLSINTTEWKVRHLFGSDILDMSNPKYKGSVFSQTSAMLQINDVNESDESIYEVEVRNTSGHSVTSNHVTFKVAKDIEAVHFFGPEELYTGETAKFTAFVVKTGSSKVTAIWQKIDGQNVQEINISDEKHRGSTTELPTPVLHIHFVRKEDQGNYQIAIISEDGSEDLTRNIFLQVHTGECDMDGGEDLGRTSFIGFHSVHDPNIALLHKETLALKINGKDINGTCFTNRPIGVDEEIYIRIVETFPKWISSLDFGLTDQDPSEIDLSNGEFLTRKRNLIVDEKFDHLPNYDDVLCFKLTRNGRLEFSINDIQQPERILKKLSASRPLWLMFDLYGKTRAIQISTRKPKTAPCNSYYREYSF